MSTAAAEGQGGRRPGRGPGCPLALGCPGKRWRGEAWPLGPPCSRAGGKEPSSQPHPLSRTSLPAAVGFLAVSSVVTMSAPFFLGKVIDAIYASPTVDSSSSLTELCLGLTCVFLCGAAANAVRVYLMQSSGRSRAPSLPEEARAHCASPAFPLCPRHIREADPSVSQRRRWCCHCSSTLFSPLLA